jgi:hypothetical protein
MSLINQNYQGDDRKRHSFIGDFIFVGTDKYIQIIFIGFKTDEYWFGTGTDECMTRPV